MAFVRDAVDGDAEAITDIYNALLESTTIEWTDRTHTVEDRLDWLRRQRAEGRPVLVADEGGVVVGVASYGDFRDTTRWPGYRFTVEHSIHVHRDHWGFGIGRRLIDQLSERAREAGVHVMIAGIDADNDASIEFHRRFGFVEVGRLNEIGWKHDRWLDLVLMQLTLQG